METMRVRAARRKAKPSPSVTAVLVAPGETVDIEQRLLNCEAIVAAMACEQVTKVPLYIDVGGADARAWFKAVARRLQKRGALKDEETVARSWRPVCSRCRGER
jgi:hypothetical protein